MEGWGYLPGTSFRPRRGSAFVKDAGLLHHNSHQEHCGGSLAPLAAVAVGARSIAQVGRAPPCANNFNFDRPWLLLVVVPMQMQLAGLAVIVVDNHGERPSRAVEIIETGFAL